MKHRWVVLLVACLLSLPHFLVSGWDFRSQLDPDFLVENVAKEEGETRLMGPHGQWLKVPSYLEFVGDELLFVSEFKELRLEYGSEGFSVTYSLSFSKPGSVWGRGQLRQPATPELLESLERGQPLTVDEVRTTFFERFDATRGLTYWVGLSDGTEVLMIANVEPGVEVDPTSLPMVVEKGDPVFLAPHSLILLDEEGFLREFPRY